MTKAQPKNDSQPKQLNIRLSEDLHRKLKAQCALDGVSLADAVDRLARAYVSGKVKITDKAEG